MTSRAIVALHAGRIDTKKVSVPNWFVGEAEVVLLAGGGAIGPRGRVVGFYNLCVNLFSFRNPLVIV